MTAIDDCVNAELQVFYAFGVLWQAYKVVWTNIRGHDIELVIVRYVDKFDVKVRFYHLIALQGGDYRYIVFDRFATEYDSYFFHI